MISSTKSYCCCNICQNNHCDFFSILFSLIKKCPPHSLWPNMVVVQLLWFWLWYIILLDIVQIFKSFSLDLTDIVKHTASCDDIWSSSRRFVRHRHLPFNLPKAHSILILTLLNVRLKLTWSSVSLPVSTYIPS